MHALDRALAVGSGEACVVVAASPREQHEQVGRGAREDGDDSVRAAVYTECFLSLQNTYRASAVLSATDASRNPSDTSKNVA